MSDNETLTIKRGENDPRTSWPKFIRSDGRHLFVPPSLLAFSNYEEVIRSMFDQQTV